MSFKSILRDLKDMKNGFGSMSRREFDGMHWRSRTKTFIAPDVAPSEPIEQGQWANLPPELLLDIIRSVEESETAWPARKSVIFCASVCKSWRAITKEIVKTPEECGRLTFPISLKQPGPREAPIQCFIKRDRTNSIYRLYFGLIPSEDENDKLLLAAKKIRRTTSKDFVISLVAGEFSRASNTYFGKLRSNLLGTKFTICDSHPPNAASTHPLITSESRRFNPKQISPKLPSYTYSAATISYELVLRTRGPRRMHCVMQSIPVSSIQEGGTAPTPTEFSPRLDKKSPFALSSNGKEPLPTICLSSPSISSCPEVTTTGALVLKNKAPRWHEQLQCWCLNFKGRVTVASVKNFQLVADVDPSVEVAGEEKDKVILQFGKIGKDIFTMDYRYPLSAFQAFAICLSSFDTKPVCE